jgi:hypothetical protein
MKRLPKVAAEMALHVLAYNLTRVMNIIGVQRLLVAMRAPLHLTVQVHAAARATATPWRFRSRRSPSVRMSTAAIRHNAPAAKNAGR